MQAASPILIDVRMGGRLVTIPGSRDEMCSTILDKLDLDIDQFYLMLNGKLLQWGRVLGDYDVSERFTIQVLPILRGGGTFFSFLVHSFFLFDPKLLLLLYMSSSLRSFCFVSNFSFTLSNCICYIKARCVFVIVL